MISSKHCESVYECQPRARNPKQRYDSVLWKSGGGNEGRPRIYHHRHWRQRLSELCIQPRALFLFGEFPFARQRDLAPRVRLGALSALADYCEALVPAKLVGVCKCTTRRTVSTLDVLNSPSNLSFWVSQIIRAFGCHLGTRQRLRNSVGT